MSCNKVRIEFPVAMITLPSRNAFLLFHTGHHFPQRGKRSRTCSSPLASTSAKSSTISTNPLPDKCSSHLQCNRTHHLSRSSSSTYHLFHNTSIQRFSTHSTSYALIRRDGKIPLGTITHHPASNPVCSKQECGLCLLGGFGRDLLSNIH
jgi:hypothetical protein